MEKTAIEAIRDILSASVKNRKVAERVEKTESLNKKGVLFSFSELRDPAADKPG